MTQPSCVRCENSNHEACDGGAWDERYKPVVCECFMLFHADEPLEPCECDDADLCPTCEENA